MSESKIRRGGWMEPTPALVAEATLKKYPEILHFGYVDIILPPYEVDQDELSMLIDEFKDGLPPSWAEYGYKLHYVDDLEDPRYLAKVRRLRPETDFVLARPSLSVLNEMMVAGNIEDAIFSPEMQEALSSSSFSSVRYPKPLIGVKDRERRETYRVRRWVDGNPVVIPPRLFEQFCGILKSHGVDPDVFDFHSGQFVEHWVAGRGKELVLIDAETLRLARR